MHKNTPPPSSQMFQYERSVMKLSACPLTASLAGHKHVNNIVKLLQSRYNLFNLKTGIIGSLYNILRNVRVRHGYSLCMLLGYALNKSVACM